MGFFSFLRRKLRRRGRTRSTNFRSYTITRKRRRKPIKVKRSPIQKSKQRIHPKKERRLKRLKFFAILAAVIATGMGLIYLLYFTTLFEIQNIDIKGNAETLDEQATIQEYMEQFLGQNMLALSTPKHEDILLEGYPYLEGIKINRRPFHSLVVHLETHELVSNIQVNHEDGSIQNFVVNELGYIASMGINETLSTIVMDVTGTNLDLSASEEQLQVNQEIIPQDTLTVLLETKEAFEGKFNMQIFEIHYLKRARELHLFTERYFFVWIDLTQNVDLQLAKLKKTLTALNIYEADLEYIDLRISGQNGEKVIYKLIDNP